MAYRHDTAAPGGGSGPAGSGTSGEPRADAPGSAGPGTGGLGRVARGATANLVGAAVATLAAFALVVVVARGMSKTDAGVFFSTTSLFLVATTLGQLGTDLGLVYFLSRSRALNRLGDIGAYLRAALGPVLAVSAVLAAVLLAAAPWWARITNGSHQAMATGNLRVLALFVVPTCVGGALLSATRGLGSMRPYVLVEQVFRQVVQVLLVAAVVTRAQWIVTLAWSLPYAAWLVAAYLWYVRLRADYRDPAAAAPDAVFAPFWRFTAPRTVSSIAQMLLQRIDIVIVGALAGAAPAAVFTASTRFAIAGQAGSYAVSLSLQPVLAGALARHDLTVARRLFQVSAAWMIAITWPMYLSFCVFGDTLLAVFGSGYTGGAHILTVVVIGLLIGGACGDVDSVLVMSGRTVRSLANTVLGVAVMVGLDFWLVPHHGAFGAAIGWCVALAVKNLAGLAQVWSSERMQPLCRATVTAGGLALVCYVGVAELVRLLPVAPLARLVLGVGAATAVYAAGVWVGRRPLELQQLRGLRRRPVGAATASS